MMKPKDYSRPFMSRSLRNDAAPDPRFQRIPFRQRAAFTAPKAEKRIEHYPVVPFSSMAQMQDIPLDKYPNLSSYISGRIEAHPSISDAVVLVLLNQFLSIPVDFYPREPYTRPQRVFSREQLDEFRGSMRVFEVSFTDGYPIREARTGSFKAKTRVPDPPNLDSGWVPPSSYLNLYGQVATRPHDFDLAFLSYKSGFIPGRESLGDACTTSLAAGKYESELGALLDEFDAQRLDMPAAAAFMGEADPKARASVSLYALATRCDGKIPQTAIAIIRKLAGLTATIESEADSILEILPADPKGLVETVAKHVGSKGALIVSGDATGTHPDGFRMIRPFQNVTVYQRMD